MSFSVVLLAFGLAADAFAVAIGQGAAAARQNTLRTALIVALAFGVAQTIAPLIGWSLGYWFTALIEGFDHWVAFGLLLLVGLKMIWEGAKASQPADPENASDKPQAASGWALMMLALATAIDAAAAGITLPTLDAPVFVSVAVIGAVTFTLSFIGVWLGRAGSNAFGSNAAIVGGLILIVIGAKVLIDHRAFG
jgi:manganese efflux pump family protein